MEHTPTVSIGLPVYNGEKSIQKVIESLLVQSFKDFELIISDNASIDKTGEICEVFAAQDNRIKYIRQVENIGPEHNFEYVFNNSRGTYFMWAADDDLRSSGFIEKNLLRLESDPEIVFSSAPNCFEGEEGQEDKLITFSLEGSLYDRIIGFMSYCWVSHACFSSLMRRELLVDFPSMSNSYLAFDWSINLHLLMKGKFSRIKGEILVLGRDGASNQPSHIASSRTKFIHSIIPFYEFSKTLLFNVMGTSELSVFEKISLFFLILKFNISAILHILKDKFYRKINLKKG